MPILAPMQDEMHITEAQAVYLEKFLNFRGNIAELAAAMDIPLVDMIDILSAPAVQKRIKAAAKLTKLRRKMIVADIEITALETLEQVAANKYADVVERRRAAAAILRALHKPKRRRSRATNLIRSRGQCPQTDPFDDPPNNPGEPFDQIVPQSSCTQEVCVPDQTAKNAAIYCPQEFLDELHETRKNSPASNMTSSQACTSDLVDSEALYPQDETTKLLEETTQALIELDELCVQDDQEDFDPTPKPKARPALDAPLQGSGLTQNAPQGDALGCGCDAPSVRPDQIPEVQPDEIIDTQRDQRGDVDADQSQTLCSQPQRGDSTTARGIAPGRDAKSSLSPERATQPAGAPKPHFTNPTIENEPIPTPDQTLDDYDPKTGLTTPINNHTSKHQQNNHKTPYPEKDNPWESHPFARAGRAANHDPP